MTGDDVSPCDRAPTPSRTWRLAFVTGSVLFTVAAVPHLLSFDNADDERRIDALVARRPPPGATMA
jgi:hypothetical protein